MLYQSGQLSLTLYHHGLFEFDQGNTSQGKQPDNCSNNYYP